MADLWEKLRAAQTRAKIETPAPFAAEEPNPEPAPEGWLWTTRLVAQRSLTFDLEPGVWRAVAEGFDLTLWKGVFCFDTETTGLSGGAGTLAFLVGWASLIDPEPGRERPRVEVRQWFLRDLPGEPELVEAVDATLKEAKALVSFNGASFDLPLLKSRWILSGRSFPDIPHRDDLHPARRLWKRLLETCRLSRLEETVLGLRRQDDVPGNLVPALWFDYLRHGAGPDFATSLKGVLQHHAQDVYSLLCLDLLLSALARNPDSPRWEETFGTFPVRPAILRPGPEGLLHPDIGKRTPVDFWGLLELKDESSRVRSLESAWSTQGSEVVGLAWADVLKRKGDDQARTIWTSLWQTYGSYPALEELLKWLEHRMRSRESRAWALVLIGEALKAPFLPLVWRQGLEKRRLRLERTLPS
jgi:uncharacterized protein YprB with RNaseH-like and TPR domain